MTFQSSVALQQGFGVSGDLFNDGPRRAESCILVSADASYNVFGRAFTKTSEGIAAAGGTGVFGGILVTPKVQPLQGTTGGTLTPTLTLPNYAQAELLTMGSIVVTLPAAAAIGDLVVYDNTTGELSTITPGSALPVAHSFAFAFVDYFTVAAAGLAVITVTPTLKIPVLA
jgi:hypothetical protein